MREEISNKLNLPKEIILDIPKVIIVGKGEITIENHKGILSFDNNVVRINSKLGPIKIEGNNFEILYIGSSTITVSGRFKTMFYEREDLWKLKE